MFFTLFDTIVLIGIVQGLVTSLLLFKTKRPSDRFLALALIAFCLLSCKILLHTLGLWQTSIFRYFPLGIDLAIQPLIYFYVMSLLDPNTSLRGWSYLHFVPFGLSQLYSIFVYIQVLGVETISAKDTIANQFFFNEIKYAEDYLTLLSIFVYLAVGLFMLRAHKKKIEVFNLTRALPTFNWLRNILLQLLVIGLLLVLNLALDRIFSYGSTAFWHWKLFYVVVALHIYYLGFIGYRKSQELKSNPASTRKIPPGELETLRAKLEAFLENEKAYLNPRLSVAESAQRLGISSATLSLLVNRYYQKNFRELINEHRVTAAKSMLQSDSYNNLSILGIAYESGFNSEASFYRIFKQSTGKSPKAFQKEHSSSK